MALRTSTGLRNHMLVTGSLKTALDTGNIKVYSGTEPVNADSPVTGTLLLTITINASATGLSMDTAAAGGVLAKPVGAVWSGTIAATGTAGYYRHVGPADDGTASTTQPRIQGQVAVVGGEMIFNSLALVAAQVKPLDSYAIALPTL